MAFRVGPNINDYLGGLRNVSGLQQGMPEAPGPAAGNMSNFAGMNPGGVRQGVAGNFARPNFGSRGTTMQAQAMARRPPNAPPAQGGVLMNAFRGMRR